MKFELNKLNITFLFYIAAIVVDIFILPKLIFVHIFSTIYIILIYKYFSQDYKKYLSYNTIYFSIVGFSLAIPISSRFSLYFMYLSLAMYFGYLFFSNIRKINLNSKLAYFKGEFKNNRYFRFYFIFTVYLLAGIPFVKNFTFAYKTLIVYIIMIPLSMMIYMENRTFEDIKKTLRLLFFIFIGILLVGTLEVFGIRFGMRTNYLDMGINVSEYYYFNRIPITFFYNQNNYAVFLVLGMSGLFSAFLFSKDKKSKLSFLILFIISQINLIFTTGRISWISLIILFLFTITASLLIRQWKFFKTSIAFLIMSLFIFFSFSLIPGVDSYYGKINDIPFMKIFNVKKSAKISNLKQLSDGQKLKLGESGSINERYTIMQNIAKGVTIEKNFLGFGVGNTMEFLKTKKNTFGIINPHSMWLECLGDFGIFIFLYYLYMYASIILKKVFSYNKVVKYEQKKLMVIITNMFFVFAFLSFAPSTVVGYQPFWILIGLTFAFARLSDNALIND